MLPANLAKGRTAARGLGELLMVSPGSGVLQTLRYSPYSVASTNSLMMTQSLTFSSPNQASFDAATNEAHSPLMSLSGTNISHDFNSLCQLQLFGAPDIQLTMNQLLAAQLSLGAKTGFSSPPPQQQNQFQPHFETSFDSGRLRTSFCEYFGAPDSFGQTVHVGM